MINEFHAEMENFLLPSPSWSRLRAYDDDEPRLSLYALPFCTLVVSARARSSAALTCLVAMTAQAGGGDAGSGRDGEHGRDQDDMMSIAAAPAPVLALTKDKKEEGDGSALLFHRRREKGDKSECQ